ncbi:MFS family permease [Streptacidiphilus sp. MAP12-20]|uniref:MFS transporter n=1 Tax=Streptacidiphilus sp. MAP12-20 TaxID=3156299 RepID=UPI00351963A7
MTSTPPHPVTAPPRRPGGAIIGVLACAGIVVSLMQTLIVPLIPNLPHLLHSSAANTSWAITATLLAAAVATPVLGRLGDMFGKRRMLVASLLLLVAGSLVSALGSSLASMIVGRALQGCGMAVVPLGISVMRDELPPEKLGSAMALMSSSLGIGGALGLPAAATIAQHSDWHMLFWTSGALGAAVAVLVVAVVPESPLRAGGSFDVIGAAGLSAGLLCLLLGISKGGDWGWGSGTTLGMFAAAAAVLAVWAWWELRRPAPLVDLRTTMRRQVLLTNVASIVVGFAMYAMSLIVPQLLELPKATGYGLGRSMVAAGLVVAPSGLVMMAVSPLSARLSAARGPKASLLTGALVIALGYGLALPLMHHVWGVLLFSSVIGAGIAFAYAAMPALIMSAVPPSETAAANGLNTLMRSIGTSTSAAVMGVVLSHLTIRLGPVTLPSAHGFRVGFVIGGGVALLAALLTLAIPGRKPASTVTAAVPQPAAPAAESPADARPAAT